MENLTQNIAFPFLQDGGEMGHLTRNNDWAQTPLGSPDQWPQSLRTTVAMILSSKFPMFLWWGEDMIQFYNDAYRPSLGDNGKHPIALGQNAADCWPEIWDIIYPLVQQVRTTGEATWSEDRLVPIYRNGKLEDVYWTFGYSPIRGDLDNIDGVLVVCTETTEKVTNLKKLEETNNQLAFAIEATELGTWDYNPFTNKFTGNVRLKEWFGLQPEEEIDLGFAIAVMAKEDQQRVTAAIQNALQYSSGGNYDVEYAIVHPFTGKERIVKAKGRAWFGDDKIAYRFNGTLQDVTEQVLTSKKIEKSEAKLRSIMAAAPAGIGLFVGRDLIIEMPNQTFIDFVGKGPDIIGKQLRDVMPELLAEKQPFLQILDDVYTSGKMFQSFGSQVRIVQHGIMSYNYYNITYTPLFDANAKVYAILDIAIDVTEEIVAKQKVELSENNLRNMILQAPVAMCLFKGPDYVVEIANDRILELWGKTAQEVMYKPIFEGLPEIKGQGIDLLLHHVYTTGETFTAFERPVDLPRGGKIETTYINFVYEPFYEANGVVSGIMAVAVEVTEQVLARQKIEEVVAQRTKELAETNDALVRSNEELTRSNINLEEFAYAASHDLKEPVRKVRIFCERLKNSLGNRMTEEEEGYFHRIERSSKRMTSLIDDLLSYSQVSIRPRTFEEVDVNQIIDLVLIDLDYEIEEKGATVVVDKLFTIQGHHRQLQQAFQNLVGNSLKYSKASVPPLIKISCSTVMGKDIDIHMPSEVQQKQFYEISVSDNGVGFEQKDAERIFNVFTRLYGNAEYSGTGVGLSIARKVIQNHQGYIIAEGKLGEGAKFKVFLPVESEL